MAETRIHANLELYLQHGRKSLHEDLDDWGPNGPTLKNCIGVHGTYQNLYAYFASPEACEAAAQLTGWTKWDDNSLQMKFCDTFLVAKFLDGSIGYFGDWGFINSQSAH